VIVVKGFSKTYGKLLAVDDLSFEVPAGQILGLVGPNGAGKTTTLRALAGIIPPTRGVLSIAGYDIVAQPIEAKRRLALVPDQPSLFASLTVFEHLEFTAQVFRLSDWRALAIELLERFELEERRDTVGDELSHGMRQKVVVACALLHQPSALILDEPLTGLDPRGIRTLYDALRESANRGAAVIVSTHLLGELETLCSQYLIVSGGRRLLHGSKDEIRGKLSLLKADASLEEIFFRALEGEPVREVDSE
jgi:ABC-2 type transport system ATP-binding protein